MNKYIATFICVYGIMVSIYTAKAQTTLAGDHFIDGNLTVGTSSNKARLLIDGQTGDQAAPGLSVLGDGGVFFSSTLGVGKIPIGGAGARLMWYSRKAAFRSGYVSADQWDDSNVGLYSFASGYNAKSAGEGSIAFGTTTSASSDHSVAIGAGSVASNLYAVAIGGARGCPKSPVS